MGRRGGGRTRSNGNWETATKENAKWEAYYKAQPNLVSEEEWDAFKQACQSALPLTFRVTSSTVASEEIKSLIQNDYVKHTQDIVFQGEKISPPKPLPFYEPLGSAWQIDVGKQVIRRSKEFSRLQRFLVVETEAGNIYRQEAVSMIPPLFLDVKPHHAVIDLCAAPGSKTAQLVEFLHQEGPSSIPTGFVLANDSDYKRAHMLIHQVKRLNSPNLIVTNHDAQMFPRMKTTSGEIVKFDRVLCDVPCSGDGTMRKNVNVWTDWKIGNGNGLHNTQLNILLRGIQMLKPGGRLVYSTCSLNPVENEAVVAEALRRCGNTIGLVDVSNMLPGLKRKPGVDTWKVQNKAGEWIQNPANTTTLTEDPANDDLPAEVTPAIQSKNNLPNSLFPPSEEEKKIFALERCVRVYPHQQNTGGFFITVFEKFDTKKRATEDKAEEEQEPVEAKKPKIDETVEAGEAKTAETTEATEAKTDEKNETPASTTTTTTTPKETVPVNGTAGEEVFRFLSSEYPDIVKIWKFYNIESTFPGGRSTLLVRNTTGIPSRAIYYVAPSVKPLLELNDHKVKFVHAGLRIFSIQKSDSPCPWRVHAEAINIVAPHINKNPTEGENRYIVAKHLDILKHLIETEFPLLESLKEVDEDVYKRVSELEEGTFILEIPRTLKNPEQPKEGEQQDKEESSKKVWDNILYPIWRGKRSVNLMLAKQDLAELVHRVFGQENIKARKTNNNGGGKPKSQQQQQPQKQSQEQSDKPQITEVKEDAAEETTLVVEEVKQEETETKQES